MTLAEELAKKHGKPLRPDGYLYWDRKQVIAAINEAIERCETAALVVIDSDELYDILPGDGQDDYICGELTKMIRAKFRSLKGGAE